MFIGTIFGLFAIPVLFVIFQTIHEKIAKKQDDDDLPDEDEPVIQAS